MQNASLALWALFLLETAAYARADDKAPQTFDIGPQALSTALTAFARQSHEEILFAPELVAHKRTEGVKGTMSPTVALRSLLRDSGLPFSNTPSGALLVGAPIPNSAQSTAQSGSSSDDTQTKEAGKKSSQDFRVAEADQGDSGTQVDQNQGSSEEKKVELQEVVVTGTHIRGVSPTSSVITLDQDYIKQSGYTNIGDVLRTLPQNYSGGSSPQVNTGSTPGSNGDQSGGSAPNLHGLGSTATLTLIDGHRLADDSTLGAVDISLIPVDAIDRIEVLTDGASAVYGSDAVAGVVNIRLKKSFQGLTADASIGGATDGGGFDRRINALAGTEWEGGGGVLDYEHDQIDAVNTDARDFTSTALTPATLLPASRRDSVYGYVHQAFADRFDAYAQGLYTARSTNNTQTYPFIPPENYSVSSPTDVKQYLVAAGLNARLTESWLLSLVGSLANQNTHTSTYFSLSEISPPVFQQFLGKDKIIELSADGPLIELPSGPMRAALGGGYAEDSYENTTVGQALPSIDGSRNVRYVFGEILVPLAAPSDRPGLYRMDVTASGRYQRYSDVGSDSVPKLGLLYMPTRDWTLKGTWGKSFNAPPLPYSYGSQPVYLVYLADPRSAAGQTLSLLPLGGNQSLKPETANIWTAGFAFRPTGIKSLSLEANYFHIIYRNRIGALPDNLAALSDPADASLITRNPTPQQQQYFVNNPLAASGGFINASGAPYNPATVGAIVDGRFNNVASQTIDGVDATADYRFEVSAVKTNVFANAAYLELREQPSATAQAVYLSGTAFNPPRFRGRAGATFEYHAWTATLIENFTGQEVNTYQPDLPTVSPWFTTDVGVAYSRGSGALSGFRAALSVQNVFDRNPPFVLFNQFKTGYNFDPVNDSPMGRYVTLRISKSW